MPQTLLVQANEPQNVQTEDEILRRLQALQATLFYTLGNMESALARGDYALKKLQQTEGRVLRESA